MNLRAPTWAAVTVWVLAIVNLYYFRVADPDLWVHLRCGGDILRSGQVAQVDTYSFTAAGLPLLSHEWLAQVLFAWFFQNTGASGLVALKMAVGIGFLVFFWQLLRLRSDDWRIVLPVFLIGAHTIGRFLLFRPQMFTFLFLVVTLYVLELQRRRATKAVWVLPVLVGIWANLHAGFTVGLAVIGFHAVILARTNRDAAKQLGWVWIASVAATLLNPHGVLLWKCIAQTTFDPLGRKFVQEWQPVWRDPSSWNSLLFFAMTALALFAALVSRKWTAEDVLLVLIFAWLGCSSVRHVPLFAVVVAPLIVKWFASFPESRSRNLMLAGVFGAALVPVGVTSRCVIGDWRPRIRIEDDHFRGFPKQAVEFLRRQPAGGNAWNELAWGGYMIWTLSPQWKVSLDGRNLNVYPSRVLRDHFELFASDAPDISVLERYPVDVCLFSTQRKLAGALEASGRWELVYRDDKAVVYRNRSSALTNLVKQTAMPLPSLPAELFLER